LVSNGNFTACGRLANKTKGAIFSRMLRFYQAEPGTTSRRTTGWPLATAFFIAVDKSPERQAQRLHGRFLFLPELLLHGDAHFLRLRRRFAKIINRIRAFHRNGSAFQSDLYFFMHR